MSPGSRQKVGAVLLAGIFLAGPAGAAEGLKTRTETHVRAGDQRRILSTSLWSPLQQEENRVLYGDLRVMEDNGGSREANVGLGYRQLVGEAVWGGYMYLDRRSSPYGSLFWQTTLGAERLGDRWEARANLYVPLSGCKSHLASLPEGPVLAGSGIYTTQAGYLIEEPQPGFDVELGRRLPVAENFLDSVWIYGGAYAFHGDETPDIAGVRARLRLEVAGWLELGARAQYDSERETQTFLEATVRFPGARTERQGVTGRLDDSPQRDIDIVTGSVSPSPAQQPVISTLTGAPQQVVYVDNTAAGGGDGSAMRPFATLADAQAHLNRGDILYIRAGDGTSSGLAGGLSIAPDQVTVQGEGSALTFESSRMQAADGMNYDGWVLAGAGGRPILTNTGGGGVTVTGQGTILRGFQIDGAAGNGVTIGSGTGTTTLENMEITGQAGDGVVVSQTGAQAVALSLRETAVTGNLGRGLVLADSGGGTLSVDLGSGANPGGNDIYGNMGLEIEADTDGMPILAEGNFWGGGVLTDTGGPDAGIITATTVLGGGLCPDCDMVPFSFVDQTGVQENQRIISAPVTLQGFTGTRYVKVTGAGAPDLVVNGVPVGGTVAAVRAGDSLAVALTSGVAGLETVSATVSAGNLSDSFDSQNRFLPNAVSGLIGWWDGADIDGDFVYDDNPGEGTLLSSWGDKSGYGNTATAGGTARPVYETGVQNGRGGVGADGANDSMTVPTSPTLSAMNDRMTVFSVLEGQPSGAWTSWFSYGSCSFLASSRCVMLQRNNLTDKGYARVDTSGGNNQTAPSNSVPVFDGTPGIITTRLESGGKEMYRNGIQVFSTTYNHGVGFGNAGATTIVNKINGHYFETILYSAAVSPENRGLVEQYLADKWGIH